MSSSSNGNQFGDTTLTKVFVGGLAWETPKDALREHFEQYGDILEAVIISDKLTGRSKGYGFVTFKEAEAAAKACEDAAPVINGRRANCNVASLGAKRDKPPTAPTLATSSSPPPRPPQPQTVPMTTQRQVHAIHNNTPTITNGGGLISVAPVRWYYPAGPAPYQPHHQAVPYFGFSPAPAAYVAPNMNYNQKMGVYSGGFYNNGQLYPVAAHQMMPMYPLYQYHNQPPRYPAHLFPAAHRLPTFIPKAPTFVPPTPDAMVGV